MNAAAWSALGAGFGALCGLLGVLLVQRNARRKDTTDGVQQFIDQLQENNATAEERHQRELSTLSQRHSEEIAEVRGQVAELRGRVSRMEDRELAHFDYEYVLRAHIDQRKPPPPPQWPPELMHRLPRDRG